MSYPNNSPYSNQYTNQYQAYQNSIPNQGSIQMQNNDQNLVSDPDFYGHNTSLNRIEEANCCKVPGEEITPTNFYKKSANPKVALIYAGLKVGALAVFVLFAIILSNSGFVMAVVLLINLADYWFTKNIAGRIMVGLRWYITFSPENHLNTFHFESKHEIKQPNADRLTFWIGLYFFSGAWLVLMILNLIILNLMWVAFCLISLGISLINTYGYFKSSKIQQNGAAIIAKGITRKYNERKEQKRLEEQQEKNDNLNINLEN